MLNKFNNNRQVTQKLNTVKIKTVNSSEVRPIHNSKLQIEARETINWLWMNQSWNVQSRNFLQCILPTQYTFAQLSYCHITHSGICQQRLKSMHWNTYTHMWTHTHISIHSCTLQSLAVNHWDIHAHTTLWMSETIQWCYGSVWEIVSKSLSTLPYSKQPPHTLSAYIHKHNARYETPRTVQRDGRRLNANNNSISQQR